jgi:hypothetical protein
MYTDILLRSLYRFWFIAVESTIQDQAKGNVGKWKAHLGRWWQINWFLEIQYPSIGCNIMEIIAKISLNSVIHHKRDWCKYDIR